MAVRRAAACGGGGQGVNHDIDHGQSIKVGTGRTLAFWTVDLVHARAESTDRLVALAGESNGDERNEQVL